MSHHRLWILAGLAAALVSACTANPEDRSSASQGHEDAAKTHREFARDFENAGNDTMAKYHAEKAEQEVQQSADEQCGLLCAVIETLGIDGQSTTTTLSRDSCRDQVTTSPATEPRC